LAETPVIVPFALTVTVPIIIWPLLVTAVTVCVPAWSPAIRRLLPRTRVTDPPAGAVTTATVPETLVVAVELDVVGVLDDDLALELAGDQFRRRRR